MACRWQLAATRCSSNWGSAPHLFTLSRWRLRVVTVWANNFLPGQQTFRCHNGGVIAWLLKYRPRARWAPAGGTLLWLFCHLYLPPQVTMLLLALPIALGLVVLVNWLAGDSTSDGTSG